jgi:uncharacterized protein YdeI (YjbR/CyaY-like superfamily)
VRFFRSAAAFERWLTTNHAKAAGITIRFYKTKVGRGLPYRDAIEIALCYGWIDGVLHNVDEESHSIRFSPRRKGSHWSAINIKRAKALAAAGRMTPAGLKAFRARDESKTIRYSYELDRARFGAAQAAALRANPKAATFFAAQPPGYRKLMTFMVMSAKQEATRQRRMDLLIERSASGQRVDLLRPRKRSEA